jgi:N-acetylglucosaminyl-diphospho-decaprenol L-rhamnosyltransferase
MDLSILIVTYNSRRLIDPLLTHLQQELAHLDAEVVLVDNASYDGTAQQVRAAHPWVRVIDSTTNLGFAAGNNLAARHARGRHLLLLNPDALPAPGALRRGITLMDQHPQAGLGGGELRGTDGSRQPSARMFPTLRDEFFTLAGLAARHPTSRLFGRLDRRWADPEQAALVDWIPGAFVFIPAAVWARLGGFDERFFMYYEEVDLCRRLQAAGLQVHYWPTLKATHIGGASARTVAQAQVSKSGSQLERWRMRSALLYYRKQHGPAAAALLHALERGWHRLRQLKARLQGRAGCAAEFDAHCRQLVQAWHDTAGGQRCPARPW